MRQSLFRRRRIRRRARGACSFGIEDASGRNFVTFMRQIGEMVERLDIDAKRKSSRLETEKAVAYLDARFDRAESIRDRLGDDMAVYEGR